MTPEIYNGLKWGALFGGPLAVLEAFLSLLALQENNVNNFIVANLVLFPVLEALLPFIAGFLAARQSSAARSGWIAGLTSGLIVAAVNMLTELLYPAMQNLGADNPVSTDVASTIINGLLSRVITIGLGFGMGWLAGTQALRFPPPGDKRR